MTSLSKEDAATIRRNPPDNMSLPEAAAYMGIGVRKLWNERKAKRIRYAQVGTRIVFQRAELDRYLSVLSAASAR